MTGRAMTSIEFADDFAARFVAAWNSRRPEQVLALLHQEVVYDDSGWPTTMHGPAEVRPFLEYCWRAFPDMDFTVLDGPFVGRRGAAYTWRCTATFDGPADPPGYAPTGQEVSFDGVDVHEYRDGLLIRVQVVFDTARVAHQLGVLPAPGSRGERLAAALQRSAVRARRLLGPRGPG